MTPGLHQVLNDLHELLVALLDLILPLSQLVHELRVILVCPDELADSLDGDPV